jgi:hypothetical protein
MTKTLEQQIAAKEAELARLRNKRRELDTGQKIILGGMLLRAAREDARIRDWVLKEATKTVTRPNDQKRLQPLLDELAAMPSPSEQNG